MSLVCGQRHEFEFVDNKVNYEYGDNDMKFEFNDMILRT